jgi:DivIVA domain-containing protein
MERLMAITPQAIKDQEFQIKFRGYDTVEVKAYLELIAEEFFELLEQVRQQIDELDIIVEERDSLANDKKVLEEELHSTRGSSEEIQTEFAERDSEVAKLQNDIETLKSKITALESEKESQERILAEAHEKTAQREKDFLEEKERTGKLLDKIEELEKQNQELRGEEIDFKSTLVAAQKFTNDLKKKSEQEAHEVIEKAKSEAERLRQETFAELASYPAEIEKLKKRRNKVREDLEEILKLTLENLDIFKDDEEKEDYGELFQKIKFDNNGLINTDELENLDMDLELPTSNDDSKDEVFSMRDEMRKMGEDFS